MGVIISAIENAILVLHEFRAIGTIRTCCRLTGVEAWSLEAFIEQKRSDVSFNRVDFFATISSVNLLMFEDCPYSWWRPNRVAALKPHSDEYVSRYCEIESCQFHTARCARSQMQVGWQEVLFRESPCIRINREVEVVGVLCHNRP